MGYHLIFDSRLYVRPDFGVIFAENCLPLPRLRASSMAVAGLEISTATASAVAVLAFLLYALGSVSDTERDTGSEGLP